MLPLTQAVISAGGKGTRLRPFTDHAPKPMIPILGKPLLEWHVEQFKKHGVREFFFTLGYMPQVVRDYFGDGSRFGVIITYCIETTPLGSAGSLATLAPKLNQVFYFVYGDVFSLVDYTAMARAYAAKKDSIGMERIGRTEERSDSDLAELDSEGRFIEVHKKSHTREYPHAYSMRGTFVLDKDIVAYIEKDTPNDLGEDVRPRLITDKKNFYSYECRDYSKGINTTKEVDTVEAYLRDHGITPWW